MRNSLITGLCLSFAILGGIIGAGINDMQRTADIEQAWSNVTVVKDGILVAHPAYYADHPAALAAASNVRIVDNDAAAIAVATNTTY